MLYIKKSNEPKELTAYKKKEGACYGDFSNPDGKTQVEKSLLDEQGYLCAYCMKRIYETETRIEHWTPQSDSKYGKKLALEYKNMLGVCYGWISNTEKYCEANRGNIPLTIKPTDINLINQIKYTKNGDIYSDDEKIDSDLNITLKLNIETLRNNRLSVWEAIEEALNIKSKNKEWSIQLLEKQLKKLEEKDSEGKYKEYCGIGIYFLRKRLKK